MFQCHVCSSTEANQECTSKIFVIAGRHVLVEGIPANICSHCGEATFSSETMERIRCMMRGEAQPVRAVAMEVFTYA
jgi:HTH-type transcriptional regulator / antitoxin MqsA